MPSEIKLNPEKSTTIGAKLETISTGKGKSMKTPEAKAKIPAPAQVALSINEKIVVTKAKIPFKTELIIAPMIFIKYITFFFPILTTVLYNDAKRRYPMGKRRNWIV